MKRFYTDFFLPKTSFLTGIGSVLSLGGINFFYNRSESPELADARAIHQDFAMIGQDIQDVAKNLDRQAEKQLSLNL